MPENEEKFARIRNDLRAAHDSGKLARAKRVQAGIGMFRQIGRLGAQFAVQAREAIGVANQDAKEADARIKETRRQRREVLDQMRAQPAASLRQQAEQLAAEASDRSQDANNILRDQARQFRRRFRTKAQQGRKQAKETYAEVRRGREEMYGLLAQAMEKRAEAHDLMRGDSRQRLNGGDREKAEERSRQVREDAAAVNREARGAFYQAGQMQREQLRGVARQIGEGVGGALKRAWRDTRQAMLNADDQRKEAAELRKQAKDFRRVAKGLEREQRERESSRAVRGMAELPASSPTPISSSNGMVDPPRGSPGASAVRGGAGRAVRPPPRLHERPFLQTQDPVSVNKPAVVNSRSPVVAANFRRLDPPNAALGSSAAEAVPSRAASPLSQPGEFASLAEKRARLADMEGAVSAAARREPQERPLSVSPADSTVSSSRNSSVGSSASASVRPSTELTVNSSVRPSSDSTVASSVNSWATAMSDLGSSLFAAPQPELLERVAQDLAAAARTSVAAGEEMPVPPPSHPNATHLQAVPIAADGALSAHSSTAPTLSEVDLGPALGDTISAAFKERNEKYDLRPRLKTISR